MRMFRLFLPLLAVSSMLALAADAGFRRAPSFSLPDSKLRQHDLLDFRGKVVILDFMMTNCPHCVTFSKTLERVKAKYGDKVVVLSVVNYASDNSSTVAKYVQTNKITAPILYDCGQVMASYLRLESAKQAVDMPHAYVIDAQGRIRGDYTYSMLTRPYFEGDALFADLDALLAPAAGKSKK
jgi:peroxiredoxin